MKVSEDYESMNATIASVHAFNFNLHGSKLKKHQTASLGCVS